MRPTCCGVPTAVTRAAKAGKYFQCPMCAMTYRVTGDEVIKVGLRAFRGSGGGARRTSTAHITGQECERVLKECGGNQRKAAMILGMCRRTMLNRINVSKGLPSVYSKAAKAAKKEGPPPTWEQATGPWGVGGTTVRRITGNRY